MRDNYEKCHNCRRRPTDDRLRKFDVSRQFTTDISHDVVRGFTGNGARKSSFER